jgi:hypothetical protein
MIQKKPRRHKAFFLNAMVYYLFQDFPNNFIRFAKDNHWTYRSFIHGLLDAPFWYQEVLGKYIPKQK